MTLIFKILSVLGAILGLVLLLLVWVAVMPRHFWVEYCKTDGVQIKMNIGFFKISLFPVPQFIRNKTGNRKTEEKPASAREEKTPDKKDRINIFDDIQLSMKLVKDVVSSAKGIMRRIFRAIKFRDVSFTLPVHSGDVYKTQQLYGVVTNSFFALSVFLQKHLQITFKSPIFVADFADRYKDSVYFYTQITASPVLLMAAAWFAYNQYNSIIENNKKPSQVMEKENNNG